MRYAKTASRCAAFCLACRRDPAGVPARMCEVGDDGAIGEVGKAHDGDFGEAGRQDLGVDADVDAVNDGDGVSSALSSSGTSIEARTTAPMILRFVRFGASAGFLGSAGMEKDFWSWCTGRCTGCCTGSCMACTERCTGCCTDCANGCSTGGSAGVSIGGFAAVSVRISAGRSWTCCSTACSASFSVGCSMGCFTTCLTSSSVGCSCSDFTGSTCASALSECGAASAMCSHEPTDGLMWKGLSGSMAGVMLSTRGALQASANSATGSFPSTLATSACMDWTSFDAPTSEASFFTCGIVSSAFSSSSSPSRPAHTAFLAKLAASCS
mmetsp:Transcript_55252/g.177101  ORF Transcript_55252/g.177101 Transcript_55252/m.177101 type:complete len:325 (-) Transcript_55252:691-1665(-)